MNEDRLQYLADRYLREVNDEALVKIARAMVAEIRQDPTIAQPPIDKVTRLDGTIEELGWRPGDPING